MFLSKKNLRNTMLILSKYYFKSSCLTYTRALLAYYRLKITCNNYLSTPQKFNISFVDAIDRSVVAPLTQLLLGFNLSNLFKAVSLYSPLKLFQALCAFHCKNSMVILNTIPSKSSYRLLLKKSNTLNKQLRDSKLESKILSEKVLFDNNSDGCSGKKEITFIRSPFAPFTNLDECLYKVGPIFFINYILIREVIKFTPLQNNIW